MQEEVLYNFRDCMVVKLDEDVFVTKNWLNNMLNVYSEYEKKRCLLVSPVILNNNVGKHMFHPLLIEKYGNKYSGKLLQEDVAANPYYAVWLWRQLLHGDLMQLLDNMREKSYGCMIKKVYLNINCILFGAPIIERVSYTDDRDSIDEQRINIALKEPGSYGIMTSQAV